MCRIEPRAMPTMQPSVEDVEISFYANRAEANRVGREIAAIFADRPGRGLEETSGNLVFFLGQERQLTPREQNTFDRVVRVATGP